jgi:hypothetical protein
MNIQDMNHEALVKYEGQQLERIANLNKAIAEIELEIKQVKRLQKKARISELTRDERIYYIVKDNIPKGSTLLHVQRIDDENRIKATYRHFGGTKTTWLKMYTRDLPPVGHTLIYGQHTKPGTDKLEEVGALL